MYNSAGKMAQPAMRRYSAAPCATSWFWPRNNRIGSDHHNSGTAKAP